MTTATLTVQQQLDDALGELNALGSPEAIAGHLSQMGITGTCEDIEKCAVAEYVKSRLTGDDNLWVFGNQYDWSVYSRNLETMLGYAVTEGTPVARFVRAFDAREFPGLVAVSIEV